MSCCPSEADQLSQVCPEIGMAATEERNKQEMGALEVWIDETEKKLYDNASKEGRRRSSVILSDEFIDLVENVKKEYEDKGFMKRRVQEAMETALAVKPFTSAKFGTLREKNNTLMNFIVTLEAKQIEKKEADRKEAERIEREKIEKDLREEQRKEAERLETERRERGFREAERKHAEWLESEARKQLFDIHGNPLKLSGDRQNQMSEGLFIGSIYVGGDRDSDGDGEGDTKDKSWRVKL